MPAIVICQRRWRVGSDDFVIPASVSIVVRLAWIVSLLFVRMDVRKHFTCSSHFLFELYLYGALAVFTASLLTDVFIFYNSNQGTIFNSEPRRHVASGLLLQTALIVMELGWTALGTYWVYHSSHCPETLERVYVEMEAIIISGWVVLGFVMCSGLLAFQCIGGSVHSTDSDMQQVWESRLRVCGSCANADTNAQGLMYQNAAKILTNLFGDLDLVPSDVAAGLVLLSAEQHSVKERNHQERTQTDRMTQSLHLTREARDFELGNQQELKVLQDATFFVPYMLAAYGWPLYVYMKLKEPTGSCHVVGCAVCHSCAEPDLHPPTVEQDFVGDNCCGWNIAAALRVIDPQGNIELVYASYSNRVLQPCYYVALDHVRKTMIISIRGSMSIEDAFTDALAYPEPLSASDCGIGHLPQDDVYAHQGIAHAAMWILKDMTTRGLLRTLSSIPGYTLHILGHSLGAGCASLLAIMLRPSFPTLRCWAYSVPAGVSLSLARYSEDFVVSIVLGEDVVPRLNELAVNTLRDDLLDVMQRSRKAKWVTLCTRNPSAETLLFPSGSANVPGQGTPASAAERDLEMGGGVSEEDSLLAYKPLTAKGPPPPPMFPPGRILHLVETGTTPNCCGGHLCGESLCCANAPRWDPVWAHPHEFDRVIVSPDMILHHLPDVVGDALRQACARYSPH